MKTNSEYGEDGSGGGGCRTSPETAATNHGGAATKSMRIIREEEEKECNSSSSSSIGDNSDDECEGDAQSGYRYDHLNNNNNNNNNGSFDDAIQALEEALPIRRGISTFYNGKSKSFTSLSDVWPSSTRSIQDIAKPENAYTRKRRNLLASALSSPRNKLSSINTGRIMKKPKPTTTTLRFTLESEDPNLTEHVTQSQLKQNNLTSLRSFSMVNLCHCNSTFGFKSAKIGNC